MDTSDFEAIVAARDLAAAEAARAHAGPHSVTLTSLYWRTQGWIEKSLVIHMVQDQRGPHLRAMYLDFLGAPEPEPEYRDHVELTKAVCLVQLEGKPALYQHYSRDRAALRRDVELAVRGGAAPVAPLLGTPTPIAPPSPEPPRRAVPIEAQHAAPLPGAANTGSMSVLIVAAAVGVLIVTGAVVAVLLLGG